MTVLCACGAALPEPGRRGSPRKHCSVYCKNKAADEARRARLRAGIAPVAGRRGPERTPDSERVCRWCGRSTVGRTVIRECAACEKSANRNGRAADGRPIARGRRRVGSFAGGASS